MTEDASAYYCGEMLMVAVVVQYFVLRFDNARYLVPKSVGILTVVNFAFVYAHDIAHLKWRILWGASIGYFLATIAWGEYRSRQRRGEP